MAYLSLAHSLFPSLFSLQAAADEDAVRFEAMRAARVAAHHTRLSATNAHKAEFAEWRQRFVSDFDQLLQVRSHPSPGAHTGSTLQPGLIGYMCVIISRRGCMSFNLQSWHLPQTEPSILQARDDYVNTISAIHALRHPPVEAEDSTKKAGGKGEPLLNSKDPVGTRFEFTGP